METIVMSWKTKKDGSQKAKLKRQQKEIQRQETINDFKIKVSKVPVFSCRVQTK